MLSLLLTCCQRPEDPVRPQQLLPKAKMESLLADFHLAEAQVEAAHLSADSARALFGQLRQDLLWKHEVPDSVFLTSYQYYAIHNKDLDEIYGAVIDSLALREVQLTGGPKPAPTAKW